jgi:hypothetical protein
MKQPAYAEWCCPSCGLTERTAPNVPNRWHVCPKLKGISIQLVRSGISASVVVNERLDYIGKETVQLLGADRRPVMNVTTVRDDGQDVVVYAPTANARSN